MGGGHGRRRERDDEGGCRGDSIESRKGEGGRYDYRLGEEKRGTDGGEISSNVLGATPAGGEVSCQWQVPEDA